MIQRGIGVAVGALVSLVLLVIMTSGVQWQDFVIPLVVGALAAFFWPIVIGWWLARRAKERQQGRIESEVQRQLDEQRRRGG